MNEITPYDYCGKTVRMIIIDDECWWIASDVCRVLGIVNAPQSVKSLDDDEKSTICLTYSGPKRNIVNEPGLYSLTMKSKKKKATKFRRWITHDILPTIRKTGSYSVQPRPEIPATYPEALRLAADLAEKNEEQRVQLEAQGPKVEAFDTFLTGENAQTMNEVAKSLGIGRNKLFAFLRGHGVLMRNNLPYQRQVKQGRFVVRQVTVHKGDRTENIPQTLVTPKGIEYIRMLLGRPKRRLEIVQ